MPTNDADCPPAGRYPQRIAIAQTSSITGDLPGNAAKVLRWVRKAADRGAETVVFPELHLTGAVIGDLALRRSFAAATRASLAHVARELAETGLGDRQVLVGHVRLPVGEGLQRAVSGASWLSGGRVVDVELARSAEFDDLAPPDAPVDDLYCAPSAEAGLMHLPLPGTTAKEHRAVIVLGNCPYVIGDCERRRELLRGIARRNGAPVIHANAVGGRDELVFDGLSTAVCADGALLGQAPRFREELLVVDVDGGAPAVVVPAEDDLSATYEALVTATRDHVRNNGFGSVLVGLSGGVDSALVSAVAADSLGPQNVHAVLMPSEYTRACSTRDAEELVRRQGIRSRSIPIDNLVAAFQEYLRLESVAAENIQVRIRGTILMALSNSCGHFVLTTGNKSELCIGNSTLYGDSTGGFDPIKDLSKSMVWALCRWRNRRARQVGETAPIPDSIIEKAPSAELRPNQFDSDSLPDYALLDELLADYVERNLGREELVASGYDKDLVTDILRRVDAAEYKRRLYPVGPKVTRKSLGRDRVMPLTNLWRE